MAGSQGTWFENYLLEASIPDLAMETEEWWDGTASDKTVKGGKYGNVGCSFYLPLDSTPVYTWIAQHMEHVDSREGVVRIPIGYKRDVMIMLLDGYLNPTAIWKLLRCHIKTASYGKLSYANDGEPLTVSLELEADRIIQPITIGRRSLASIGTASTGVTRTSSTTAISPSDNSVPRSTDIQQEQNSLSAGDPYEVVSSCITQVNLDPSLPSGGSYTITQTYANGSSEEVTRDWAPTAADYQAQIGC
jgi:hypothetical protein